MGYGKVGKDVGFDGAGFGGKGFGYDGNGYQACSPSAMFGVSPLHQRCGGEPRGPVLRPLNGCPQGGRTGPRGSKAALP